MPGNQLTSGYAEISKQLKAMGQVAGSRAMRAAAMQSTLPARKAIKAAAPVGKDEYTYPAEGGGTKVVRPYPRRTYKGRLVTPGFHSRSVRQFSHVSADRQTITVDIGLAGEAFEAIQFTELGTSKQPSRPWFEPAFRRSLPDIDRRFWGRLKALIDKAAESK